MTQAKFTTLDGISIEIDGTPEELSAVLEKLRRDRGVEESSRRRPGARKTAGRIKTEIPELIEALRNEEFFRQPQGLGAIRVKLGEMGHHYPLTTLSGAMQAEVKKRRLRRFKQEGKYVYVQ